MESLVDYLGYGKVYKAKKIVSFTVTKLSYIEEIVSFFESNPLIGMKFKDFEDWKKVVLMMKKGVHLTESGLKEIMKIREGMNMRRKDDNNDNE